MNEAIPYQLTKTYHSTTVIPKERLTIAYNKDHRLKLCALDTLATEAINITIRLSQPNRPFPPRPFFLSSQHELLRPETKEADRSTTTSSFSFSPPLPPPTLFLPPPVHSLLILSCISIFSCSPPPPELWSN